MSLNNSRGSGFSAQLLSVSKGLPLDLWTGGGHSPPSTHTTTAAFLAQRCCQDVVPQPGNTSRVEAVKGLHRLFRELTDSLLELPTSPNSPEAKNMLVSKWDLSHPF